MHALCTLPSFLENTYTYVRICTVPFNYMQAHTHMNTPSLSHTHLRGEPAAAAHKCAHPSSHSVSRNNYVLLDRQTDSAGGTPFPAPSNHSHTPEFCTYIFYSRIFVDFNSFLVLWRFNYHVDAFTTAFGHFDCFSLSALAFCFS